MSGIKVTRVPFYPVQKNFPRDKKMSHLVVRKKVSKWEFSAFISISGYLLFNDWYTSLLKKIVQKVFGAKITNFLLKTLKYSIEKVFI